MTDMQELAAADPIFGATRAHIESLQLERLRSTLHHAYANNAVYRRKFDAAVSSRTYPPNSGQVCPLRITNPSRNRDGTRFSGMRADGLKHQFYQD